MEAGGRYRKNADVAKSDNLRAAHTTDEDLVASSPHPGEPDVTGSLRRPLRQIGSAARRETCGDPQQSRM